MLSRRVLVAVTVASLLLSALLHIPTDAVNTLFGVELPPPIGAVYSDIIAGLYWPTFEDPAVCASKGRWFDEAALKAFCSSEPRLYLPYLHYTFEYPPVVGAIWALSTNLGFLAAGFDVGPSATPEARAVARLVHYAVQSVAIGLAALVTVLELEKIARIIGGGLYGLLPLLPSFVVYAVYNWDLVAAAFMVLSLRLFMERRFLGSGIFMGLAVSAKLIPIAAGAALGYELLQEVLEGKKGAFSKYLQGTVLGLLPYIFLVAATPEGFRRFVEHHATWYCENCLFMLVTWNPMAPETRALSMLAVLTALLVIVVLVPRRTWPMWVLDKALLSVTAFIVFNYVFTPQMLLLITPLLLLVAERKHLPLYLCVDVLNAFIILLWFHDSELRRVLSFLGLRQEFNPWSPDSPIQMIAAVRNILLLYMLLKFIPHMLGIEIPKPYVYTPPPQRSSKVVENISSVEGGADARADKGG